MKLQNSLEAHVDKLKPEPSQSEHEHHVGESESKPGRKIDDVSVVRKEPEGTKTSNVALQKNLG